ncbi:suppressor of fused domain protein [Paraburkholderia agricolaris]|uniref:Suppressor of fused domain protein n=1 Tax=Paraburkholderia agricolaris TaxID=2152888 RepID=A0ABW8ZF82_9BURK|nr:suppressor of fused domain protein [Paraburkholderia agricolaris]
MTIIDHFEKYLGTIKQGWGGKDTSEEKSSVMVARFSNVPFDGASTYATIGLSDTVLALTNDRQVRQELMFAAHDIYSADAIASFLLTFSDYVRSKSCALARGDVVGPSSPLIPGVISDAIYTCPPVIFPTGIDFYSGSSPSTIIAWLVPLIGNESSVARQKGSDYFEGLLEAQDPDLLDLNRVAVTR